MTATAPLAANPASPVPPREVAPSGRPPGRSWLFFAIVTTISWGVWGALIEIPEKAGFPSTLAYCVWALTTVPCALVAHVLNPERVPLGARPFLLAFVGGGLLGSGGQLLLFEALKTGPAYIVFPIISLYPLVTIVLSVWRLGERVSRRQAWGVGFALVAMLLLSYVPPAGGPAAGRLWLILALGVFLAWGAQAYALKRANEVMGAESVFIYLSVSSLTLIPLAIAMTDFERPIEWGWKGPYLAALIHVLNSLGTLALCHAIRHGKAVIVVPLTALAPVLTVLLSLALYRRVPLPIHVAGLLVAFASMYLLADVSESESEPTA